MSILSAAARQRPVNAVLVFGPTIFLSAWSLFLIQPLFAKMALPLLGGSPNVWNIAMVFFQGTLLLGYLYAHLLARFLRLRLQIAVHLGLMLIAFVALPVGIGEAWRDVPNQLPALWLLGLLAACVGLPFLAVAANAPLLQHWFAQTDHADAGDPYFLYAASNMGSILALLSYPILLEPAFAIATQSWIWTAGYALLVAMILACGSLAGGPMRSGQPTAAPADAGARDAAAPAPAWRDRLTWVLLAFVPSGLLLSVTTYITTDIVAVPLLWVVPLSLYLLTYVLVFAQRQWLGPRLMLGIQAALLPLAALSTFLTIPDFAYWQFGLALAAFFATAMVCHGALAARRPAARHLTEFYLFMSLGGILGGVFTALVAPTLFDRVIEYPILLVLAALLRPHPARDRQPGRLSRLLERLGPPLAWDLALPGLCILAILLADFSMAALSAGDRLMLELLLMALLVIWVASVGRPLRFALTVLAVCLLSYQTLHWSKRTGDTLTARSFFGVYRVAHSEDGAFRLFFHGSTLHGAQSTMPSRAHERHTYYHGRSGIGRIFAAIDANRIPVETVGAIGLGVGELACYRSIGQRWTFYEIDPLVARIARDPDLFGYLSTCAPGARIVLGDGRLTLARDEEERYDLLVLDAFTSDAIPLHLMTREAFALYLARLAPDGLLAVHISNRHMDLKPVLARLAAAFDLSARVLDSSIPKAEQRETYRLSSVWVALARNRAVLDRYAPARGPSEGARPAQLTSWDHTEARWTDLAPPAAAGRLWTDDYSNIWSVMK